MSKQNPGWFRRNVNRTIHPEDQTAEQAKRAPAVLAVFLGLIVIVAVGVWALRVFVFEPAQATPPAPQHSTSTAAPTDEVATGTCTLDNTNRDISTTPPEVTRWVVERWAAIPEVAGAGPCTEHDGYRVGFAHTETGAVLATYHYFVRGIPASPDAGTRGLLEYALVDGPLKDGNLQQVEDVENGVQARIPDDQYDGVQIRGYRVVDFDDDTAVIELLIGNDSSTGSVTVKLVWQNGDWRIDPASANGWGATQKNVSAQGFVPWALQPAG